MKQDKQKCYVIKCCNGENGENKINFIFNITDYKLHSFETNFI